ncbi:MAG: S8 family serine peptidase [Candidatus Doudnabacteria bacterium]|nr:S8 family serine peptidase [Candidatus Doudnabacteria bacterium]
MDRRIQKMKLIKPKLSFIAQAALMVLLATSIAIAKPVQAESNAALFNYVVKLNSGDSALLESFGTNLEQKFAFSKNPEFANTFSFSSTLTMEEIKQRLAGSFDYLELDRQLQTDAKVTANDPAFTKNSNDKDKQWGLPKAEFLGGWDKTTGDRTVIVAVIDTGIDGTHRDLRKQSFVKGYNFIEDTGISRGSNSDDNGHGTMVAGIIGAVSDNGIGITGGAWDVSLMPIKALNFRGSGSSSNISEAIVWATDNGASVINMSLGGIGFAHETTLSNAISYAFNKNVVIVSAAGNDVAVNGGNINDNPVFPVCADNSQNMIIGVTATDIDDKKPPFANYGKSCVDVSAPGRRILSTINYDPVSGESAPNAYAYGSGTSMAVPYVSAQAVLLRSYFPEATNREIRDRIIATADPIDDLNPTQCGGGSCEGFLGSGRINVEASLQDEVKPYVVDGDVVQLKSTGQLYFINGAKRHLIIPFVKNQRFASAPIKMVSETDVAKFPEGSLAEPLDGTLVKANGESTVYYMQKGLKFPVTGGIFKLYNFSYSNIQTFSPDEVNSWVSGGLLTPPNGLLVRTPKNGTIYWIVDGTLHPINYGFFINRGLNIFPVIYVSDEDMRSFPKGDPYIL